MVVINVIIDGKIKKRHYLMQVNDFFLNWEFNLSYSERVSHKLKEVIKELLLEDSSCPKEKEIDIEGVLYLIKVEKKEASNGGNNYQKLSFDLQKEIDTRNLKSLILYNRTM